MKENLVGTLEITVYGGCGEKKDITKPKTKSMIMDMYNESCDIFNDDANGLIKVLNDIWDIRHPDENPGDSKELMREYEQIHERMCDDVWRALSWHCIDWESGKRYALLSTPCLIDGVWKISVSEFDL